MPAGAEHGSRAPDWVRLAPPAAGAAAVLIALFGLLAWAAGDSDLTALGDGLPTMKIGTALALLAAGVATRLLAAPTPRRRRAATAASAALTAIGLAVLVEWVLGVSLGIDQLLGHDPSAIGVPGRPAPQTAAACVALGPALLTLDARRVRWQRAHAVFTGMFGFAVVAVALGYLYGSNSLTRSTHVTGVAPLTAIALIVLAIGLITLRPEREPLRWLWARDSTATLARRLLPAALFMPPLLGFLRLLGQEAGLYDLRFGLAVFTGSMIAAYVALVLLTTRAVGRREQDLRAALVLHGTVLETTQNAYVAIDERGLIIAWNPAAESIFGWLRAEAVGSELAALLIPERYRDAHRAGLRRYLGSGSSRMIGPRLELSALRADGTELPVELTIAAAKDRGRTTFHAFIADISDRLAAEHDRQLLASVVQSTEDAVITSDLQGRITSWNPAAERLYGYAAGEIVGRPFSELHLSLGERERSVRIAKRLLAGETVRESAVPTWNKDGQQLFADLSAAPLRDERGAVIGMLGVLRDVTEQHRLQLELAGSEERFRTTFEEAPIGMAIVAPDGRWLRVNQRLCEIFGYTQDELLERRWQEITHPDELDAGIELVRALYAGERDACQREKRYFHKDGHVIWAQVSVSVARDADGLPVHSVTQVEDITAAKETDRALREERRLLSETQTAARIGSWERDVETGAGRWSQERFRLHGLDPAEGVPSLEHYLELVHPEDRESARASIAAQMSGEKAEFTDEYRIIHPELGTRSLLVRGSYVPADPQSGRPARIAGTAQDVTAERVAQAAQREVEERHRLLLASLPDTIVSLFDRDLRCVLVRGAALGRLGVGSGAFEGKLLSEYVPAEQFAKLEPLLTAALAGRRGSLEYTTTSSEQTYHVEIAPYKLDDQTIAGVFATWFDVTERLAREQESRVLATIVQQSDDAIIVKSLDGVITEWNEAAERLYGYPAAEAVGRSIRMLLPRERIGEDDLILTRAAAGQPTRIETTRIRKDGERVEVSVSASPIHDAAGQVTGVAVIARDVTETNRLHRELQALFDNVPAPLVMRDRAGRYRHVNAYVAQTIGIPREQLIGMHPSEHYQPDVAREIEAQDEALLRSRKPSVEEITVPQSDGELHDYHVVKYPILDAAGEVSGFGSFSLDITDRKRSEVRLIEAQKRFRGLLESAPDAIVIVDQTGNIALVNGQAEELFGYGRREMVGQPVEMLMPEGLRRVHSRHRDRFLGKPATRAIGAGLTLLARRKDGTEFPVEISLSPLQTDGGLLISSAIRDVSARKAAEREREGMLRQLRDAQRIARMGSWTWDPQADQTTWSEEMYRIFGRDPSDGPTSSGGFLAYVHPDDRERMAAGYAQVFGGGPAFELDYRIVGGDGRERVLHALGHEDPDRPGCYLGTVQDVTEMRRAELVARAAEDRFRRTFENAPIGMALVSLDGAIEEANVALGVICSRPRKDLEGIQLRDLVHPGDIAQARELLRVLSAGNAEQVTQELRFMPVAGSPIDVSVHAALLRDGDGQPSRVLCQLQDVTERKLFEEQLQFMADHDPLTGLLNRRKFEEELDRHVAHVKRYGDEGALIVLDIDHFKQVNDTLGHNAGDELIVSIAGVLRERLRESDILARLGGDEFAVLLPKADETEAAQVARALMVAVRTSAAMLDGVPKRVTASIGVAMFESSSSEELTGETILIEADLAMYDAKEAGRDGFAFHPTSEHRVSRTKARLTWANRIEHALDHDRFALVAQPILDLRGGGISQHELQVRMLDDDGDLIPPAAFLYVAERFGLVGRLDEWVTSQAIELIEKRPSLQLEVNISGRSLGNQHLLEAIEDRLQASGIDPAHLIFEVTETAAVANISQAQAFAQHLRDLGCRFALDDFGAGFGSFYYLKHLPFDYVKIDGEFVQHAVTGQIDQLVIEAVVGIAQGLGKETIAEFVTNAKTQRMVQRLGVDYAQGHHVGKPVPVSELFELELH